MAFDPGAAAARHDPARWTGTLRRRDRGQLPFDPSAIPAGTAILLDTTVYIDALKGQLRPDLLGLIATQPILHGAPALAELSMSIGHLDPADPRTAASAQPIHDLLARVAPHRVAAPAPDCWIEAAVVAGILARTQGIARQDRRKLLNDVLLFLQAEAASAVLVSRNIRDLDLLLQIKPTVGVLLYDRQ